MLKSQSGFVWESAFCVLALRVVGRQPNQVREFRAGAAHFETTSRSGSKHHTVTCGRGTPLALSLSGANHHDPLELLPLVDAILPVKGKRRRSRRRPEPAGS